MKLAEHDSAVADDPRGMSGVQLARLGIQILNKDDLMLQCMACGEAWTPQAGEHGKLPYGHWHCPNKCNA